MPPHDPYTIPEYDRAALITIDVQNDALDGGTFHVPGTSAILPRIQLLCRTFREAGRPIVHVIRIYTPDAADADRCRRRSLLAGERILLKGSVGRRPAEALLPGGDIRLDDNLLLSGKMQAIGPAEAIIFKPRWGAFYRTPLEDYLRKKKVSTLIFCGCNYPNCPRASMYQASERDFRIAAAVDAISGMDPSDIPGLEKIGTTCAKTEEICRFIREARLAERSNNGKAGR